MQLKQIPAGTSWFSRTPLDANLVAFTEPFLNDYFRANFYHLKGRDLDLVVDAGMGLAPLVQELDLTPGKPVLAVATHIHADHVGSLHEFAERAGPRRSRGLRHDGGPLDVSPTSSAGLAEPVTRLPHAGWKAEDYRIAPRR